MFDLQHKHNLAEACAIELRQIRNFIRQHAK
jgi:hypothetical protein